MCHNVLTHKENVLNVFFMCQNFEIVKSVSQQKKVENHWYISRKVKYFAFSVRP